MPTGHDRFERVLDAMLDDVAVAVAVRDDGGTVVDFTLTYVNDRSVDGAGRRRDELVNASVLTLYPQWRASGLFDRFRAVVDSGVPYVADALHYVDEVDGRIIEGWWRLSVVRFGDGYLATSRDVTAEVRAARDLEAARAMAAAERNAVQLLQEMALPRALPAVAGVDLAAHYRPAEHVVPIGGDWYDAFVLPDGRVGVVVGDVAGHGRSAAASMVRQRTTVTALARLDASPATVLTRANAAALAEGDAFTTCCYAVVDLAAATLTIARAGHPPAVLVTHGRTTGPVWSPAGLPLGVDGAAVYREIVVPLDGPSTLVLYTDGLIERRGDDLADSIARLSDLVDAGPRTGSAALCTALVDAVAGDRIDDDFCVLVCTVTPT